MGTKFSFSTRHEKICAFCENPFIAKLQRAMYCSKRCKGKALAKQPKRDTESGLWPKTCSTCGKNFFSKTKNKRMCPECSDAKRKESVLKWHKNHPEWQKTWDKEHPESRKKSKRKWEASNPDKVVAQNARHEERRAEKRVECRQEKAIKRQEELSITAVKYGPASKLNSNEFLNSIGIIRLTSNLCRCVRCNHEFYVAKAESSAYRNLTRYVERGSSPCPYCSKTPLGHNVSNTGSKYEYEIMNMYPNFTERGFKPEWMKRKELDLYDPISKVGIEFHGLFAHSDRTSREPTLHYDKANLADQAGIQLIQIYESEWVQRRDCVIGQLDAIFHHDIAKVPAMKLKINVLTSKRDRDLAREFLDMNHIHGHAPFQWGVSLFNAEGPVAVCTFKHITSYTGGSQVGQCWELNRFASKHHINIQEGMSRCIAKFWEDHPEATELFLFADRRWSCTAHSTYLSSGFEVVGRVAPDYMYTDLDPLHPLKNKQFMRKDKIKEISPEVYSDSKTELEMAHELGYYRIYDAGKIKYRMVRPD